MIYKDNIWAAHLAEMGSWSSKNQNVKYLLCVIYVYTKYAWVKPLKDKKCNSSYNHKPNKLWVNQGKEINLCKNG